MARHKHMLFSGPDRTKIKIISITVDSMNTKNGVEFRFDQIKKRFILFILTLFLTLIS